MGFYPDVVVGQTIEPSARQENDIRHLLNQVHGFGDIGVLPGRGGVVRINVYNSGSYQLLGEHAVNFDDSKPMIEDAVPVKAFSDSSKPWGVLLNTLDFGGIGSCVVSGNVTVPVSGVGGEYAEPQTDGTFQRSDSGNAKIIYFGSEKSVIVLGYGGSAIPNYNGYFTIKDISTVDEQGVKTFKVRVCDGSQPNNSIAGRTDIGYCNAVEFTVSSHMTIYLNATYSDNAYHLELSTTPGNAYYEIGSVFWLENKLLISQTWTSGYVYFGERFFIGLRQ